MESSTDLEFCCASAIRQVVALTFSWSNPTVPNSGSLITALQLCGGMAMTWTLWSCCCQGQKIKKKLHQAQAWDAVSPVNSREALHTSRKQKLEIATHFHLVMASQKWVTIAIFSFLERQVVLQRSPPGFLHFTEASTGCKSRKTCQ